MRRPGPLVKRFVLPPARVESLGLARAATALGKANSLLSEEEAIVQRVVYAAGDPSIARFVRFSAGAISVGITALRAGRPIIADVRMVEVGLDLHRARAFGSDIRCYIDDADVTVAAHRAALPRAVMAMQLHAEQLNNAIVVIGNAPSALLSLLDLIDEDRVTPALIVGMPVGFVAATESKQELMERSAPYITVEGTRGGSAMAVAATNALLRLAQVSDAPSG
jgi:precorrin-8X/cobalt-precorrin-8 methylmutase